MSTGRPHTIKMQALAAPRHTNAHVVQADLYRNTSALVDQMIATWQADGFVTVYSDKLELVPASELEQPPNGEQLHYLDSPETRQRLIDRQVRLSLLWGVEHGRHHMGRVTPRREPAARLHALGC